MLHAMNAKMLNFTERELKTRHERNIGEGEGEGGGRLLAKLVERDLSGVFI